MFSNNFFKKEILNLASPVVSQSSDSSSFFDTFSPKKLYLIISFITSPRKKKHGL